jgi:hypothetical protein
VAYLLSACVQLLLSVLFQAYAHTAHIASHVARQCSPPTTKM